MQGEMPLVRLFVLDLKLSFVYVSHSSAADGKRLMAGFKLAKVDYWTS